MKIIASFILLLLSSNVRGQQPEITGRVLSLNNRPIGGVNVIVKGTSQGTVTDMNGHFDLRLPEGDIALFFSYQKRKPLQYLLLIREGFQYQVNVMMAAKSQTFNRSEAVDAELPLTTPRIKGRIVDQDGRPLSGVLISQRESRFVAISSADGSFTLPVPAGPNTLSFRYNGIKEFTYSLDARQGRDLFIDVSLVEDKSKYTKLDGSAKESPSNREILNNP